MANYGYVVMMEWGRGDEDTAPRFRTMESAINNAIRRMNTTRKKPFVEYHIDEVRDNTSSTFRYAYVTKANVTGIRENGSWKAYVFSKGASSGYVFNAKGDVIGSITQKELGAKIDKILSAYYSKR